MSDEAANHFEKAKPDTTTTEPQRSFTLVITLQPDNQLELTGPLGNDMLCYAMLEKARAHIQNMHLTSAAKKMQDQHGGVNGLLKRMKGG